MKVILKEDVKNLGHIGAIVDVSEGYARNYLVPKNLAAEAGKMPVGIRAQRDIIKGEGRIYPLDDFDNKKRGKVGLPPIPTSCSMIKKLFPSE